MSVLMEPVGPDQYHAYATWEVAGVGQYYDEMIIYYQGGQIYSPTGIGEGKSFIRGNTWEIDTRAHFGNILMNLRMTLYRQ